MKLPITTYIEIKLINDDVIRLKADSKTDQHDLITTVKRAINNCRQGSQWPNLLAFNHCERKDAIHAHDLFRDTQKHSFDQTVIVNPEHIVELYYSADAIPTATEEDRDKTNQRLAALLIEKLKGENN